MARRLPRRSFLALAGTTLAAAAVTPGSLRGPATALAAPSLTPLDLAAGGSPLSQLTTPSSLVITHGVASGDVTATGGLIWARASGEALLQVEYDTDPRFERPIAGGTAVARPPSDYCAQVRLDGLLPDTRYHYRVQFAGTAADGQPVRSQTLAGSFKTAPQPGASRPVSFVVVGDLGGQRYGRRPDLGYALFAQMQALEPDFWIANGDLIYADTDFPAAGPGGWRNVPGDFPSVADPAVDWLDLPLVQEVYWQHWRYNRADTHLRSFLARTPMYSQWDDHEVINDFGALWTYWNAGTMDRAGFPNLVRAGRDAMFQYSPMTRHPTEPDRVYRSFRWGQDLELFIVDARSYRSRNDLPDTPGNAKTMLGAEQLAWLKEGLRDSTAIWKVISFDIPLSILTGGNADVDGRDAFANGEEPGYGSTTGFERELLDLLRYLESIRLQNLVVVVTDVHFAANLRYAVDLDGDGVPLIFHEFVCGPVSASRTETPPPDRFDPTLRPEVLYTEGGLFNFGYVRIQREEDGLVHLIADVRGEDGLPRPGSTVNLIPR